MKIDEMTRDEKSLLLYLESRAVDHHGAVAMEKMNAADLAIAIRWNDEGYVYFGRICAADFRKVGVENLSNWCRLSDYAFADAHHLRMARAVRGWANRTYRTTDEKRDGKAKPAFPRGKVVR